MATKKKEPASPATKSKKASTGTATKAAASKGAKAPAKGAKGSKTAVKAPKAPKAEPKPIQGPHARVKAGHGSKESLIGTLVEPLKRSDEDGDALRTRLLKVSNQKLLRLARVVETVTKKYGSRSNLVAALTKAIGKAKDKDYAAKLETLPLPKLLDMVASAERRAKRAAA
jgi:hypothetical protein